MRLLSTKISNGWHVHHIHFKVMCAFMLRGNGWFFFCPDELYPESSHFSLLICGRELDNCYLPPSPLSEDRFLSSALHSEFFSSDLHFLCPILAVGTKALHSLLSVGMLEGSQKPSVLRESCPPLSLCLSRWDKTIHTQHTLAFSMAMLHHCASFSKFSIFSFLIPIPHKQKRGPGHSSPKRNSVESPLPGA